MRPKDQRSSGCFHCSPGVILVMIVRNEENVIEPCLASARPWIDWLVLCDTGSVDRTMDLVTAFCTRTGLPLTLDQQEWKDFGHNRTLSIQLAQRICIEEHAQSMESFFRRRYGAQNKF